MTIREIFDKFKKPKEAYVFLYLLAHADENGVVERMPVRRMAEELELPRMTVQRVLESLHNLSQICPKPCPTGQNKHIITISDIDSYKNVICPKVCPTFVPQENERDKEKTEKQENPPAPPIEVKDKKEKDKEKEKVLSPARTREETSVFVSGTPIPTFEDFWNLYDKKVEKPKCMKLWANLTARQKLDCIAYIPLYKQSQPDKQYRKHPQTFLRNHSWEDEIINHGTTSAINSKTQREQEYLRNSAEFLARFKSQGDENTF